METTKVHLAVTLEDATKLPLLLELLRHLDFVVVNEVEQADANVKDATHETFLASAGMWKGRDIDLKKMREDAFLRRTVNYDKEP